jgi:hypothetical protein
MIQNLAEAINFVLGSIESPAVSREFLGGLTGFNEIAAKCSFLFRKCLICLGVHTAGRALLVATDIFPRGALFISSHKISKTKTPPIKSRSSLDPFLSLSLSLYTLPSLS